jgi:8-oxo-dGTP pyrophosphatase MutT (NUDIX family)
LPPKTLSELRHCFEGHAPQIQAHAAAGRAAVALVLCEQTQGLALLMIQRAQSEGDRWSGHIAFPGGRVDAGDAGPRETAERETREEVGLALRAEDFVGRLDDLPGRSEDMVVSAFVYAVPGAPALRPNHEVEQVFWMPLAELLDTGRHLEREFAYREHALSLPAIQVLEEDEAPVLWGLSYRFLELLMNIIGRDIPGMSWHSHL